MKNIIGIIILFLALFNDSFAQISKAQRPYFNYIVNTSNPNRCYQTGEEAIVKILGIAGGNPIEDVEVSYEAGNDMFPVDTKGKVQFHNGEALIPFGTMNVPGFRHCTVRFSFDGESYKEILKVGFSPENIQTTTQMPEDFQKFWNDALEKARKVPMNVEVTPLPDKSTDKVEMSLIKLQCAQKGRYIYGYLSKPRTPGKYPVLMVPPGAGVKRNGAEQRYAEQGFITLAIEIHGFSPLASDDELKQQQKDWGDYMYMGMDNRDNYYYKNVYLGCSRAVDYLCSLPEFDGKNVGVCGGSQGGALSIVTAALNKRVGFVVSFYPALCDLFGFVNGRAGGWPRLYSGMNGKETADAKKASQVLPYYDVVNFARSLTIPGFFSFGYNDNTCPPTSVQAAINTVKTPKKIVITPTSGHWRFPESDRSSIEWMKAQLK